MIQEKDAECFGLSILQFVEDNRCSVQASVRKAIGKTISFTLFTVPDHVFQSMNRQSKMKIRFTEI